MILSGRLFFSPQSHSHELELTFLTRAVRSWTKSLRRLCRVCSSRDWKRRSLKHHLSEGTQFMTPLAPDHQPQRPPQSSASQLSRPWGPPLPVTCPPHVLPLHLAYPQGYPKVQSLGTQTKIWKLDQSLLVCSVLNRTFFLPFNHEKLKAFS